MESTPSVNSNTDPRVHEEDHCDVRTWMLKALQDIDIGVDVSDESLQTLTAYLDVIMERVLEEARVMNGDGELAELTSLDIHKAIKKLLPGNPGDPLRPYMPSKTKQAWNLDKQSLKGIKKKRRKAEKDNS